MVIEVLATNMMVIAVIFVVLASIVVLIVTIVVVIAVFDKNRSQEFHVFFKNLNNVNSYLFFLSVLKVNA